MTPIIMPQVGQDIPSATIVEWVKKEGETVKQGEVVVVVESEKAAFEVESEASGVLLKIVCGEGEEVEILRPIGYIGEPNEAAEVQGL
jgi:pyruvate/2-oxoglutarate dehydrogenase complex dihydrolipoamide acyltransferase (E2) component